MAGRSERDKRRERGMRTEDRGLPTWRAGMSKGVERERNIKDTRRVEKEEDFSDRRRGWENEGRETQDF